MFNHLLRKFCDADFHQLLQRIGRAEAISCYIPVPIYRLQHKELRIGLLRCVPSGIDLLCPGRSRASEAVGLENDMAFLDITGKIEDYQLEAILVLR